MNYFSNFHAAVICFYFTAVLLVNMIVFDPILVCICFVSQVLFYLNLKGASGFLFVLKCMSVILLCGAVNALVNHRGVTVFFYLGGLPVTLECVIYGCMTGVLLCSAFLLFGCYHDIMTSEKVMSLFGNVLPHFSLVFSMALRLIPKVQRDYKKIRQNHKRQPKIISALIALSLEDSLETGLVMKYRGYGNANGKKRTSIYAQKMKKRDLALLLVMIFLLAAGVILYVFSRTKFLIFPYVEYEPDFRGTAAYLCFALLFCLPTLINIREEYRWNRIVSKI